MFPQPFGKYLLEGELSRGGMARVFLATLRGTDGFEKKLVVKQIRDELAHDEAFVARFVTEAKTAVRLNHPNIVPVFELGVEQGVYFIAMELVRGVSIAEYLRAHTFDPQEGAYIGAELCKALEYAHRTAGIIHRDITPRNVMLDDEGQVKVIDYGIAAKALAASEGIFGSPGHMPPEQLRGEPLSPRSDLFAAALLVMECWSGKPTFRRSTPEESEASMREPHPKPSETNSELLPLDDIIGRAMALDQALRPGSAEELGKELRRFLQSTDTMEIVRRLATRVADLRRRNADPTTTESDASALATGTPRASHTQTFATRALPDVETLATRPIETPTRPPSSLPSKRAVYALAGLALIVSVGLVYRFESRTQGQAAPSPARIAVSATAASAPPSAPPSTPLPDVPESATAATAPMASTKSTQALLPTRVGAATGSATAPSDGGRERARLTLVCDPGTRAAIDGVPTTCPARGLSITKGPHDLRFNFEPTGESRSARVTFSDGDAVTVRADFASAVPQVRVSRP